MPADICQLLLDHNEALCTAIWCTWGEWIEDHQPGEHKQLCLAGESATPAWTMMLTWMKTHIDGTCTMLSGEDMFEGSKW